MEINRSKETSEEAAAFCPGRAPVGQGGLEEAPSWLPVCPAGLTKSNAEGQPREKQVPPPAAHLEQTGGKSAGHSFWTFYVESVEEATPAN